MIAVLRVSPALMRVGIATVVAYRAEMVIWILSATLPLVMLALWNAVTADGAVAGFGQVEMARYFAATLVVRQLTGVWLVWQLNHEIRTGSFSARLLRPLNPLWFEAMTMLAALPLRVLVLAPILAALVLWRPDLVRFPGWTALALFVVSVGLAWVLQFLVQAVFGLVALWWDQSLGLFGVWFGVWGLLSGYVAPLAVFPEPFRPVLDLLPFRYMLAVPAELLGGFSDPSLAGRDLAVQGVWIVVLTAVVRILWVRGVRRYGAFGG